MAAGVTPARALGWAATPLRNAVGAQLREADRKSVV